MRNTAVFLALLSILPAFGQASSLDITLEQDFSHTASKTMDDQGGKLITTDASGTTYTLEIPAKALLSSQRITLTPVGTHAQNYPFSSGIAAGVVIEPEGILLLRPARLTIEPAKPLSPKSLIAFASHEDGVDFGLFPVQANGTKLSFELSHFSDYGAGEASDAELDAFGAKFPPSPGQANAEAGLEKAAHDYMGTNGTPADDQNLYNKRSEILTKWASEQVAADTAINKIAQATGDADRDLVQERVSEWQALQNYARTNNNSEEQWFRNADREIGDNLASVLGIIAAKVLKECWDPNATRSPNEIVSDAFSLLREAQLIGMAPEDELKKKAEACLNFTLNFRSEIETSTPKGNFGATLEGDIGLGVPQGLNNLAGQGALKFTAAHAPSQDSAKCELKWSHADQPVEVVLAHLTSTQPNNIHARNPARPLRPAPPADGMASPSAGNGTVEFIALNLNNPQELLKLICTDNGQTVEVPMGSFYSKWFSLFHKDEMSILPDGSDGYKMGEWLAGYSGVKKVISHKTYTGSKQMGGAQVTEVTELKVTHTPLEDPHPGKKPLFTYIAPPTLASTRQKLADLKKELEYAQTDESRVRRLDRSVLDWIEEAGDYPTVFRDDIEGVQSDYMKLLVETIDKRSSQCTAGNEAAVARLQGWADFARKSPLVSRRPELDVKSIEDKVLDCANFELSFDSTLSVGEGSEFSKVRRFGKGRLITSFKDGDHHTLVLTAMLPLDEQIIAMAQPKDCSITQMSTDGGAINVLSAEVYLVTDFNHEQTALRFFEFDPMTSGEKMTMDCPSGGGGKIESHLWDSLWKPAHIGELRYRKRSAIYHSELWLLSPKSNEFFARKTYSGSGIRSIGQDTTMELRFLGRASAE